MDIQNHFDSKIGKIKDSLVKLKQIDFELAYLALLTHEGLKPLSRWEKTLNGKELKLLEEMGLLTKIISRKTKTHKEVQENIFSISPAYIEIYAKRFENKHIEKSPETQRFEGFLFGFPTCCVENYIIKPYAANNLEEKDQKLLFHWACYNCKITPFLLDSYKKIYDLLENL